MHTVIVSTSTYAIDSDNPDVSIPFIYRSSFQLALAVSLFMPRWVSIPFIYRSSFQLRFDYRRTWWACFNPVHIPVIVSTSTASPQWRSISMFQSRSYTGHRFNTDIVLTTHWDELFQSRSYTGHRFNSVESKQKPLSVSFQSRSYTGHRFNGDVISFDLYQDSFQSRSYTGHRFNQRWICWSVGHSRFNPVHIPVIVSTP